MCGFKVFVLHRNCVGITHRIIAFAAVTATSWVAGVEDSDVVRGLAKPKTINEERKSRRTDAAMLIDAFQAAMG